MRWTRAWLALVMTTLLSLPQVALAVRWEPMDVGFVDSMDAGELSRRMVSDEAFHQEMIERFYFSGPGVRGDFLTRWKSGTLNAESADEKQAMAKHLDEFKRLPLAKFHYLQLEGTSQQDLETFCKNHGLHMHMFRKTSFLGILSKNYHVLVSGADAGIQAMLNHFKYSTAYQDPVDEFRIEIKYKVGGNWVEFLVPTGQRYARDFGMLDAWTSSGIFSQLLDHGEQGVRNLIESGTITLHEGQAEVGAISNLQVSAFLPFVKEPFFTF